MTAQKDSPVRLYYTLKEASEVIGVKPHVLRYWDKEFKIKQERREKKHFHKYHRDELRKGLEIKKYLYDDLYTVAGAKKKLAESNNKNITDEKTGDSRHLLIKIKKGLKSIEAILE